MQRIYSQDVRMGFGIEKYSMLIMKDGKRESAEGIEWQNQKSLRMLAEKENYKYLEILDVDTIKTRGDKGKN